MLRFVEILASKNDPVDPAATNDPFVDEAMAFTYPDELP